MKKNVLQLVLLVSALTLFAFSTMQGVDVKKLLSELDKSAAPNTLAKTEKKSGWKLIFDGTSFKGWHGYNMKGVPDSWRITDGVMEMITEGGAESQDVITDKIYKSYALSLEFKLTKAANSGIIFQVAEDSKYKFPYETGPEFQIMDHENWPDKVEDWQICGANYAMYPPKGKPFKPVGEWNQVLLVIDGNQVTQVLNGEVVVQYEKYSDEWTKLRNSGKWADFPDYGIMDEGHISLQNHGTKVYYRSIKLKEL